MSRSLGPLFAIAILLGCVNLDPPVAGDAAADRGDAADRRSEANTSDGADSAACSCGPCEVCGAEGCEPALDGTDCGSACTDACGGTLRTCESGACRDTSIKCPCDVPMCCMVGMSAFDYGVCKSMCTGLATCAPVLVTDCSGTCKSGACT